MLIDLLFSITDQITLIPDFHEQIINALVRMSIVFQNRYLQRLQILKLLKRFCYKYPTKMLTCESYLKNLFEYIDIFRVRFFLIKKKRIHKHFFFFFFLG